MAIQLSYTSENGYQSNNAYFKVRSLFADNTLARVEIAVYASAEAKYNNARPEMKDCVLPIDTILQEEGDTLFAKVYNALKKHYELFRGKEVENV